MAESAPAPEGAAASATPGAAEAPPPARPAPPLRGLFGEHEEDELLPPTARLTEVMSGLRTWTAAERARYCAEETDDSPLFLPAPAAAGGDAQLRNAAAQAVFASAYDDFDTPEALARESKQKGNDAFAKGREWYPNAIRHYNEAIAHAEAALKPAAGGSGARPSPPPPANAGAAAAAAAAAAPETTY